jgi:organic radical activating enzyme
VGLVNEAFCLAPWIHTYNGTLGERRVCCISSLELGKGSTLSESWNCDEIKGLRRDMIAGKKIESCNLCNNQPYENTYKFHFNGNYKYVLDEILNNTSEDGTYYGHPITFDYRNDLCNLKCRICGSSASSSIRAEFTKFGNYQKESELLSGEESRKLSENQLREMLFLIENTDVKEIYWAGGEPLFNINHYKVLNRLVELGKTDVFLRYNTNFTNTTFREFNFLDIIKHFDRVHFYFSQDGIGDTAEYLRYGQNFEKWNSNIQQIIKIKKPEWEFYVHSVMTILTLLDVENILEYVHRFENVNLSFFKCFSDEYKDILTPEFYPKELISNIINHKIESINSKYKGGKRIVAINFLENMLDTFEQIHRSDIQTRLSFEYIDDLDKLRPYKKTFSDFLNEGDIHLFEYLNKRKTEILENDNN